MDQNLKVAIDSTTSKMHKLTHLAVFALAMGATVEVKEENDRIVVTIPKVKYSPMSAEYSDKYGVVVK